MHLKTTKSRPSPEDAFFGTLLGTAVGDSLGLPAEGLSRERIRRRWGGRWQHRLLPGYGMCSDDTEHTLFVAQALLAHPDDPLAFQRCLAWKLRLWLLGMPAGVGFATLRAILKLWIGIHPTRSGVHSAGNGPAMRSAILGAFFADAPDQRRAFVSASTRLTHTGPRSEVAADAIAQAAAWIRTHSESTAGFLESLAEPPTDPEWKTILHKMARSLALAEETDQFANHLGLHHGVSGYAYHSVPVALYAWLRHPDDFITALESALNCGGDTDTVGAMVGALMGANLGPSGIPTAWIKGIAEWPRSPSLLQTVSHRLAELKETGLSRGPVRYFWPALALRNGIFLTVVLLHGFRRLLPP